MGDMMTNPVKILIAFDIKDNRPFKGVRLYTVNGLALGHGEMVVNEVKESSDLFTHLPGYVSYSATIDVDKLFKKETKEVIRKTEIIDNDVSSTDDFEEDVWVQASMKQLKEAKCTITLTTEIDLRQDYRKMQHTKAKSGEKEEVVPVAPEVTMQIIDKRGEEILRQIEDDTPAEVEPVERRADIYTPTDKFNPLKVYIGNNGKYYLVENSTVTYTEEELRSKQDVQQLALENLAKFQEPKAQPEQLSLSEEVKPNPFSLDDFLKGT